MNCAGPFYMVRAAVGHMIEKGWGRIIGVTTSLDTMYRAWARPTGHPRRATKPSWQPCARTEGTGVTANVLVPGGPANTNLIPQDAPYDRNQLIQPPVMEKPVVWLASEASDGINGRRFIAYHWDESLSLEERLSKAERALRVASGRAGRHRAGALAPATPFPPRTRRQAAKPDGVGAGFNPARQLSFQPVAIGAGHGGDDIA